MLFPYTMLKRGDVYGGGNGSQLVRQAERMNAQPRFCVLTIGAAAAAGVK